MNELVDIEKADENDEESGGGGDATVLPPGKTLLVVHAKVSH